MEIKENVVQTLFIAVLIAVALCGIFMIFVAVTSQVTLPPNLIVTMDIEPWKMISTLMTWLLVMSVLIISVELEGIRVAILKKK